MIKSVCILGGGTSGVVTALVLKRWYPTIDITIVESSNVGIVGVGEGSTEHWAQFMRAVDIPLKELITETSATFKSGIKFDNWNGDGEYYFHALHANYTEVIPSGLPALMVALMAKESAHLTPQAILDSKHYFPLSTTVNQYHFDTHKLNKYLHKKCLDRGVKSIDADIVDVELDSDGFVHSIIDTDNQRYSADLFIDCSGFAKIISSKLGSKWVDCGDYLPMNKAFAFPTEGEQDIPSHTLSKALSSGWLWRIPTQERFGNGYVYCGDFITDDQAYIEAQQLYNKPIEIGKSFKFRAGYIDKFWIKNCVSVGLSGSFVEPLEATSIGTSIQQAFGIGNVLIHWDRNDTKIANQYNEHFEEVAKNIIDFVQLHYVTKRQDTEFWRHCQNLKLTDFNKEMIPYFKKTLPNRMFYNKPFLLFTEQNWMQIMYGLKIFDLDHIKAIWNSQDPALIADSELMFSNIKQFEAANTPLSHREALNYIMSNDFI
jgi:tryptophan halogenase